MGGSSKTTWVVGTVVVSVLMVVATWFLLASPVLAEAAETHEQADVAEQQNLVLSEQVAQLRAEFARMDEFRAELAGLRTQVPTKAELAAYLRELDAAAVARSVTLVDVQVQTPQAVTLPVPSAPAAAPVVGTDTAAEPSTEAAAQGADGATGATQEPATQPSPAVVPAGFAAVPLVMTVVGTYDDVAGFLDDIQNRTTRLFLVATLTGTAQDEAEAGSGRPATAPGDLEMAITGYTYVLPDRIATATPGADETPPPPLPAPVPGKNPFIPVAGE